MATDEYHYCCFQAFLVSLAVLAARDTNRILICVFYFPYLHPVINHSSRLVVLCVWCSSSSSSIVVDATGQVGLGRTPRPQVAPLVTTQLERLGWGVRPGRKSLH